MSRLDRHVARSVFSAILMVLLVVLSLDFMGKVVDQIDNMRADYHLKEVLLYALWQVPGSVYEYMPYAVLVGCLIGLGVLASASELVVMRAAGVSVWRICWMVLKPVTLFILVSVMLGEFVIPYTDQVAQSRRNLAIYDATGEVQRGVWHREGNEFMRFNVVRPGGKIVGVNRFRFDENQRLEQASFARKAIYQNGRWIEQKVRTTLFEPERIRHKRFESRHWETRLTPALLKNLAVPPEAQSIRALGRYVSYLRQQNLQSGEYALAYWQKLLQPVATASLVLIAISFIFGPLREVTMGQRIFTGVIFGIGFRLLQSLLGPSSIVFGFNPLIAVVIPIALCALLGFYLLRRAG